MMRLLNVLFFVLLSPALVRAQRHLEFFRQLSRINTVDEFRYDYRVTLTDASGKVTDSITGRLYKKGKSYVDSNSSTFVALVEPYYCKLDHQYREGSVYDLRIFREKLQLSEDEHFSVIRIPDSVIARYGTLKVDTTGRDFFRVHLQLQQQPVASIDAFINRKDLTVRYLKLALAPEAGDGVSETLHRVYEVRNIAYHVPPAVFDMSRYYTVQGGKATLSSRYAHYSLKTITQSK